MNNRGFISSIFDLTFSHFITPRIQRFLYALLLGVSGLTGLAVLGGLVGMAGGFFGKMAALVIGVPAAALVALLLAMYFRVLMELLIVVFRGVEYLGEISASVQPNPGAPDRRSSAAG